MEWKKLVILFLLCASMQNCVVKPYYTTEYDSYRPKKNNFKLAQSPHQLKSSDPIDLQSIYIKIEKIEIKDAKSGKNNVFFINTFLRFFPNGRFINSTTKESFDKGLNDYNNLKKGFAGYYKIENDKIMFEDFIVSAHDNGKYKIYERKLIKDSIEGFQKIKIEGLTGTPDW